MPTRVEWLASSQIVEQHASRLISGWVTSALDFMEDLANVTLDLHPGLQFKYFLHIFCYQTLRFPFVRFLF